MLHPIDWKRMQITIAFCWDFRIFYIYILETLKLLKRKKKKHPLCGHQGEHVSGVQQGAPGCPLPPLGSLLDRPLSLGPLAWSWGFPVVREHVLTCWVDAFIGDPCSLTAPTVWRSCAPSTLFTLNNPVKVAIASSGITTLPTLFCSKYYRANGLEGRSQCSGGNQGQD